MKYLILVLCLFGFLVNANADYIRLEFSVALPLPLTKEQESKLIVLQAAMADLKIDFKNVTEAENPTKSHVCRHDVGGACIEEKEIDVTDFTKIAVEAVK